MSKQQTKAELIEDNRRYSQENTIMIQALNAVLHDGAPSAVEVVRHEDSIYKYQLFRPTGAAGGLVLVTFRSKYPNQKPMTTAHYLDDLISDAERRGYGLTELSGKMKTALYRLKSARDRSLEELKNQRVG